MLKYKQIKIKLCFKLDNVATGDVNSSASLTSTVCGDDQPGILYRSATTPGWRGWSTVFRDLAHIGIFTVSMQLYMTVTKIVIYA